MRYFPPAVIKIVGESSPTEDVEWGETQIEKRQAFVLQPGDYGHCVL